MGTATHSSILAWRIPRSVLSMPKFWRKDSRTKPLISLWFSSFIIYWQFRSLVFLLLLSPYNFLIPIILIFPCFSSCKYIYTFPRWSITNTLQYLSMSPQNYHKNHCFQLYAYYYSFISSLGYFNHLLIGFPLTLLSALVHSPWCLWSPQNSGYVPFPHKELWWQSIEETRKFTQLLLQAILLSVTISWHSTLYSIYSNATVHYILLTMKALCDLIEYIIIYIVPLLLSDSRSDL